MWDYYLINQSLTNHYTDEAYGPEAERLKEEVRGWFGDRSEDHLPLLQLVDDVQRLGLGYHFKEEIKRVLDDAFSSGYHISAAQSNGLHATALCFRLFRQHGFMVSQEIFNHFIDRDGKFKESLFSDIRGVLSLFEASYLAFDGENTMDRAKTFALERLNQPDALCLANVAHALELPFHWRMTRLESRSFIDFYERREGMKPILLRLGKLDFNMVQRIHQMELRNVISWWMSIGLGNKINFIRDRIIECFFGVLAIIFYPQYGFFREELTKVGQLVTITDDVFELYGTLDERKLFTRLIDRWEIEEAEKLPKTMKACCTAIIDSTCKMTHKFKRYNGCEVLPIFQKGWVDLCKSFLKEAEWHNNQYIPTLKEYLDNGWISTSGPLILYFVHCLLVCKPVKERLQCLEKCAGLIRLASVIFRLYNDLATSMAEQERGGVPTSIQCYMIESGVSETIARKHITNMIADTWKELNKECQSCSFLPQLFVNASLDLARMVTCLYQHGDGFSTHNHDIKGHIKSLLCETITL